MRSNSSRPGVGRSLLAIGALLAAGLASGCMSSPTYGTDKTASSQLMSDISNIASFKDRRKETIDYTPRPELVKPTAEDKSIASNLPPPQEPITKTAAAQWPESPEQRLARIRAEATANQDNPNYDSPIVADLNAGRKTSKEKAPGQPWREFDADNQSLAEQKAQKAEYDKRMQELKATETGSRKYLSDPPAEYKQAFASAPQGEVGEDEYKKERRRKREARKNKSWWEEINPF